MSVEVQFISSRICWETARVLLHTFWGWSNFPSLIPTLPNPPASQLYPVTPKLCGLLQFVESQSSKYLPHSLQSLLQDLNPTYSMYKMSSLVIEALFPPMDVCTVRKKNPNLSPHIFYPLYVRLLRAASTWHLFKYLKRAINPLSFFRLNITSSFVFRL